MSLPFKTGDRVKLADWELDDGLLDMYELTGECPPQALVLLEREKRAGVVVAIDELYAGTATIYVEVEGHTTGIWDRFLESAEDTHGH